MVTLIGKILIGLFMVFVVIKCIGYFIKERREMNKLKAVYLISATLEKKGFDGILTITYSDKSVKKFHGCCTVWHTYPMMKGCDTSIELELSEIEEYIEMHGNPYPIAHLKSNPNGSR